MECCRHANSQSGFATPAALILTLALALVATALVGSSISQLHLSQSDLARKRAWYTLSGSHTEAAADIIRSDGDGPFSWTLASDLGPTFARAESESAKLPPGLASTLTDDQLGLFDIQDMQKLRSALAAAGETADYVEIADLDPAPKWKACSNRLISPIGQASEYHYHQPGEPIGDQHGAFWRVGETWRIEIGTANGWRSSRIVRFTGDAHHPVAIVSDRLDHVAGDHDPCLEILEAFAVN